MSFVDPLWEFVLEDYDDYEDNRRGFFGKSRDKRSDAKSSTGTRGIVANLTSRGNTAEDRDDAEDGFWDMISGAPPKSTVQNRRSRSFSGLSKSNSGRGLKTKKKRGTSLTRSQSNVSENSDKKRNKFKKRFSWNQNSKSSEDVSMREYSNNKHDVKHTTLANNQYDAETSSAKEKNDSSFDPFELLFHIADTLDPWGDQSDASTSDDDSHDGTGTIDDDDDRNSNVTDSRFSETSDSYASKSLHRNLNSKLESLKMESLKVDPRQNTTSYDPNRYPYHAKQPRNEENDHTTEVRLRVTPLGNTISEEIYEKSTSMHESREQVVRPWDEERYPAYRQSFDSDRRKSSQMHDRASKKPGISTKEKRPINTTDRNKRNSEEMRVPSNVHITEGVDSDIRDDDGTSNTSKVFKKAVCSLKKSNKNDSIDRAKISDAAEFFPSSRVIADANENIQTNGMRDKTSRSLIGSKGPQSVFAYDYESSMNMDVSYEKPNHTPRTSISVRKLDAAPGLSSSSKADDIVVQIEASLVSETDCIVRQGLWWRDSLPSFPNTPGIDIVGKVYCNKQTTGKLYGLQPMETVTSLVKWGGNARFMKIHPKQLVKVPEGLDPAEVACLPECYLSAFQVLHMGQKGSMRYRENSLKGKSVLILGCMTNNMGKAIIELALKAGVANIYGTAKKKHWKTLISYGVMPLSTDPMEYIQRIAGTIDLVLAPNGNLREDVTPIHIRALIPKQGQLIVAGRRIVGNDIPIDAWKRGRQAPTLVCGKNKALQKILRNSMSYDVYEQWEKNLDLCKKDMAHLLKLLESKSIKPEVLDRIPLNKIAKAHEMLERKRLPGFLVCEPWMKSKKRALYL